MMAVEACTLHLARFGAHRRPFVLGYSSKFFYGFARQLIYIYIYHMDLKVESTGESAARTSHLDSHACPPAQSPAGVCACGPVRVPPPQCRHAPRPCSVAMRPAPAVSPCVPVPRGTPGFMCARVSREILPRAQTFLL
jgi:hypothetical protein